MNEDVEMPKGVMVDPRKQWNDLRPLRSVLLRLIAAKVEDRVKARNDGKPRRSDNRRHSVRWSNNLRVLTVVRNDGKPRRSDNRRHSVRLCNSRRV
jgi:hypothetical protein